MFELSIALKYLLPKKKSLSTALISLLSVLVISLVVWLALIFLSVTSGIERNWLNKLTSLQAPIRISPTEAYYQSYYYRIDSLSADAGYCVKSIGEKAQSSFEYSPDRDREIPKGFPKKESVDPVKLAIKNLQDLGLSFQEYEMGSALLRLQRGGQVLSQMSFLLSEPSKNPQFSSLILKEGNIQTNETQILLPKTYLTAGIQIGDIGTLNYSAPTAFSVQEHKIKVTVRGFYDPGLVSIGNKCIIAPPEIVRTIQSANQTFSPDGTPTNGIFVWIDQLEEASSVKQSIEKRFADSGIAKYWKVDTYREFEFCKDLLQQFQSDKTLFLLVAAIILFVACTNIISLLAMLVNDKKKEIAIIQSMGASTLQIASIFGFCGIVMGTLGSILGILFAAFTLRHIQVLVSLLSALQGHQAFHPAFFGDTLPNALSHEALLFVSIATPLLSFAAGLIPAIKATRIRPSSTLRSE